MVITPASSLGSAGCTSVAVTRGYSACDVCRTRLQDECGRHARNFVKRRCSGAKTFGRRFVICMLPFPRQHLFPDSMTLLHITIQAQTQKHIVHLTQLLRAFPDSCSPLRGEKTCASHRSRHFSNKLDSVCGYSMFKIVRQNGH